MRPVTDFRIRENVHANVAVDEEEELVLAKHSGVTDAQEEDKMI